VPPTNKSFFTAEKRLALSTEEKRTKQNEPQKGFFLKKVAERVKKETAADEAKKQS
jgi:hypothetical protein